MENGVVSAHFGHCQYFAIATIVNNKISEMKEITPPEHKPGVYPHWVATFGVTDVIAGGIGQKAITMFNSQNINVFVGAPLLSSKVVIDDFLADKLILDVNYCSHDADQHHQCKH